MKNFIEYNTFFFILLTIIVRHLLLVKNFDFFFVVITKNILFYEYQNNEWGDSKSSINTKTISFTTKEGNTFKN